LCAIEARLGPGAALGYAVRSKQAIPTRTPNVTRAARACSIHDTEASATKGSLPTDGPTFRFTDIVQYRVAAALATVGTTHVLYLPNLRNYSNLVLSRGPRLPRGTNHAAPACCQAWPSPSVVAREDRLWPEIHPFDGGRNGAIVLIRRVARRSRCFHTPQTGEKEQLTTPAEGRRRKKPEHATAQPLSENPSGFDQISRIAG
jgi:hypothetical protein